MISLGDHQSVSEVRNKNATDLYKKHNRRRMKFGEVIFLALVSQIEMKRRIDLPLHLLVHIDGAKGSLWCSSHYHSGPPENRDALHPKLLIEKIDPNKTQFNMLIKKRKRSKKLLYMAHLNTNETTMNELTIATTSPGLTVKLKCCSTDNCSEKNNKKIQDISMYKLDVIDEAV